MTLSLSWNEALAPASQIEKYQVWRVELAQDLPPPPPEDFSMIFEVAVERDEFGAITNSSELYSYVDLSADPDNFFYFYFVTAIPVQGPSSRSATTAPTAGSSYGPVSMSAQFATGPQRVVLAWNKPVFAVTDEFRVMRSVNGGGAALLTTVAGTVFTYTDNTLDRGTNSYAYFIEAESVAGVVRTSNTKSFGIVADPTAPVLTAAGSPDVDLDWTASSSEVGIANYRIERSTNGGAFSTIQTVGGGTLTYLDDTVDRSVNEYDYRVFAIDNIGQETVSNTVHLPTVSETIVIFDVSDPSWIVPAGVTSIDILAIGGGGGGGVDPAGGFGEPSGGGGGGGGVRTSLGVSVSPGNDLAITVGGGGAAGSSGGTPGSPGGDSIVHNTSTATELFRSGGGGSPDGISGGDGSNGSSGGGGGSEPLFAGALVPPGNGNAPGNNGGTGFLNVGVFNNNAAGGGGGAGAAGGNAASATPGNGGNGTAVSGWGAADGTYGGGGGGWGYNNVPAAVFGTRGSGGGAANTGGGGNAGPISGGTAENGFSGRVVLRYLS